MPAGPFHPQRPAFSLLIFTAWALFGLLGLYGGWSPVCLRLVSSPPVLPRPSGAGRRLHPPGRRQGLGRAALRGARRCGLALTLGSGEVTLLDMTAAHPAFTVGGVRREPVTIFVEAE
jgi:hypothetical protein